MNLLLKKMISVANLVFNEFVNDSRVWKESSSLSKAGYSVEIIAHLSKDLASTEVKDGIVIKRFGYLDRRYTRTNFGKLWPYFLFILKSFRYCKVFDILHCNDLNTLPVAFLVKIFYNRNVKVVYDAHEFHTGTNGLKGLKKLLVKYAERRLIEHADKIIVVSDGIANEYSKIYEGVLPVVVLNTPHYTRDVKSENIFREKLNIREDQNIFLYQGLLSDGRGIDLLLDVFKSFETDAYVIVFMGHGDMMDSLKLEAKSNSNIYFHSAVPVDVLLSYTSSADYGISLIEDTCISYHYCLPNKLFEYIMANIPVIVSDIPEMKRVVEDNNIGLVAKINAISLKEMIQCIVKLDRNIFFENISNSRKIYNWQEQEKVLLKLYQELV